MTPSTYSKKMVERSVNEVDGHVVQLLSDEQLKNFGLAAMGDIITLRDFCSPRTTDTENHAKKMQERRDELLQILKKSRRDKKENNHSVLPQRIIGRPKKMSRAISFGLRLSEDRDQKNAEGDRVGMLVKSPLGDKNQISIQVGVDDHYDGLLNIVREAFFPDGINPVIGSVNDFEVEVVNARNQNLKSTMKDVFTVGDYINQKKIPGTPKCYLLCTTIRSSCDIVEVSSDDESEVELPTVLTHVEVVTSPSQEVVFRYSNVEDVPTTSSKGASCGPELISKCVRDSFRKVSMEDIKDPIEVLRVFQSLLMRVEYLEPASDVEVTVSRETTPIFVSRYNLLNTAMEEVLSLDVSDMHKVLEVTFYGEKAQDIGGPRREFFTLVLKELIDEKNLLFQKSLEGRGHVLLETARHLEHRFYFAAGLLCGLSLLQQGPLPCFLHEDQLQKIISLEADKSEAEHQFEEGLNMLGIVDLIREVPVFVFLMRPSAIKDVTFKGILHMLTPQFSEEGSNRRNKEENTYSLFVSYMKEVAAGRRPGLTLGSVLQFESFFGF